MEMQEKIRELQVAALQLREQMQKFNALIDEVNLQIHKEKK